MAFLFMLKHQERFNIRKMAKIFEVSISGYYAWRTRKPSQHSQTDSALVQRIKIIQKRHKGRYGSPRMWEDLRDGNVKTSRKRVARLMRQNGLSAKPTKKWTATTNSQHKLPIAENILNREFTAPAADSREVCHLFQSMVATLGLRVRSLGDLTGVASLAQ